MCTNYKPLSMTIVKLKNDVDIFNVLYRRILVELLVHGYDNSFHYFVDGLSQTVSNFARKLRSSGDLSAENLQKVGENGTINILNYTFLFHY